MKNLIINNNDDFCHWNHNYPCKSGANILAFQNQAQDRSGMFCPSVHFFLDRQKVSLNNTAFLPSPRPITGWHFSGKVSTKVLRKN